MITPTRTRTIRRKPPGASCGSSDQPRPTLSAWLATALLALAATAPLARAGELPVVPPRSLGMGGSLRGAAAGGGAIMLNPSGMSLSRSYVVEGSYQFLNRQQGHVGHVSVVDSTSAFNLAGGLYYTYATASPDAAVDSGRHEAGLALSFPFGDRLSVGGTVRYLRARQTTTQTNGFTFDAGISVRPVRPVTIGFVGYGLRNLESAQAPRAFGAGVAVSPTEQLLLAVDGLLESELETPAFTRGKTLSVFGGAEYTLASRFALRAGGGRGGARERNFATVGASLLSELGALDIGGRVDLQGAEKDLFIGLAGRLFVPTP
jgi:hypothetical protein